MTEKQNESFFDRYFDISEVLVGYYANQPTTGIDRHFLLIEDFLEKKIENEEDNKPLIIQCEEDFGVKTLLVKWMLYHQKNFSTTYPLQDIILPYFVTAAEKKTNYFYLIFRFLMMLREKLNIKQKVELLEEKLRKFFGYWLDVCNRKIEKKIIKQKISDQSKIILLIHKIDNLVDPKIGRATNIGFWLPRKLPMKVRLIATCHKDSEAMKYFLKTGCTIIRAQNDRAIAEFMIDVYTNRPTFTEPEHKKKIMDSLKKIPEYNLINPKFLKTFVSCLIPYPDERIVKQADISEGQWISFYRDFDYDRLEKLANNEELVDFLLDYYEKKIMIVEKFRKLVLILSICYKGLLFSEIMQLVKFSKEEWSLFIAIFKRFVIQFKGLFCCYDPSFKRVAIRKYSVDKDCNALHEEIANIIDRTPLSTRKLEEQTYHLFISKSYFRLKETVSIIEHFLLLFNPHNKFDLCHYWQKLLENGFDPAVEYNKAIEGFEMHYKPPPDDIFQIILQISRFLKEFADFETENTPAFKHPPISGFSELSEIGLEKEIMNVGIYKKPDNKRIHPILTELESSNMEKNSSHEEFRHYYIEKLGQKVTTEKDEGEVIMIIENAKSKSEQISPDSSFDVAENQNTGHTLQELKLKLETNNLSSINNIQMSQINNSVSMKEDLSKLNLNVHEEKQVDTIGVYTSSNENQPPTYYYYKRWLWMIFPWACISDSDQCNYSEKIMQCYSSATSYISVVAERKFTERALKIALDAKLKKKMMYAKKEELDELMRLKNLKAPPSPTIRNKKKSMHPINTSINGPKDGHFDDLSQQSASKLNQSQKNNRVSSVSMVALKNQGPSAFFITEQLPSGNNENTLLNRSKMMELKFREYNPENLMYLNKSLEESSLLVLPKLTNSIVKHSDDELSCMERKVKKFKDDYDYAIYLNSQMSKELINLQKLEINRSNKSQELIMSEFLNERIQDLETKLMNVEKACNEKTSQKIRASTVLSVCKKNKQQNEEYIRSLTFLLQNFKKCIRLESNDIKKNKSEIITIKKISNELLKAVEDKMDNHNKLVDQIKTNINSKVQFTKEYDKTDQLIENSILEALDDIKTNSISVDEKKDIMKRMSQMEKTTRSIGDRMEKYQEDYEKLKTLFEIKDYHFLETKKYKDFINNLERKNELRRESMAKRDKLNLLKDQLETKKKTLERLTKLGENPQEMDFADLGRNKFIIKKNQLEKEYDNKTQNFVRLTKSKLACNMTIKSIYEKCQLSYGKNDIKTIDYIKFNEKMEEYLNVIKSKLSTEDYEKFRSGNYQFLEIYKKAIPKNSLFSYYNGELSDQEL